MRSPRSTSPIRSATARDGVLCGATQAMKAASGAMCLGAAGAARARSVESGQRQRMSHDRFVEHLVDVLTGALSARSWG